MMNFNCTKIEEIWWSKKVQRINYSTKKATLWRSYPEQMRGYCELPEEVESIEVYEKDTRRPLRYLDGWFALVTYKTGETICYDYSVTFWDENLRIRHFYGGLKNGEKGDIHHNSNILDHPDNYEASQAEKGKHLRPVDMKGYFHWAMDAKTQAEWEIEEEALANQN